MCSIIGVISTQNAPPLSGLERHRLSRLVGLNIHRGGDGSGVWSPIGGLKKSKKMDAVSELHTRKVDGSILIHLRSATSGTKADKYNHPFQDGGIVLVHNGHISNYADWSVPMDSLAAVAAVKSGSKAMKKLEGWYVLAWVNTHSKRFHILNHRGSIQYGWDNGRLWFASIGLGSVLHSVKNVPDDTHIIFNPTTGGKAVAVQSVTAFKPVEPTVGAVIDYPGTYSGYAWWESKYYQDAYRLRLDKQQSEILGNSYGRIELPTKISPVYVPLKYRLPKTNIKSSPKKNLIKE